MGSSTVELSKPCTEFLYITFKPISESIPHPFPTD
jgi:hypothetical protein